MCRRRGALPRCTPAPRGGLGGAVRGGATAGGSGRGVGVTGIPGTSRTSDDHHRCRGAAPGVFWADVGRLGGQRTGPGPELLRSGPCVHGAGDGNRTRTTSLEGWGSAIELHPRASRLPGRAQQISASRYAFNAPPRWCVGVWRSLVAHSLWVRGAVGSNPATPTRADPVRRPWAAQSVHGLRARCHALLRRGRRARHVVPDVRAWTAGGGRAGPDRGGSPGSCYGTMPRLNSFGRRRCRGGRSRRASTCMPLSYEETT